MFGILLGALIGVGIAVILCVVSFIIGDAVELRGGWDAPKTALLIMGLCMVASAAILAVLL